MVGISALQLAVPAVEPLLDGIRASLPPGSTTLGPAHISFGYPWLEPSAGRAVLDDVAAALAREAPFVVELAGPRRFATEPGGPITVWLAPHPAAAIHALSWVIGDAAGHDVENFTPHCSLVRFEPGIDPAPVERLLTPQVPLRARLETVEFRVRDEHGWQIERTLPLGHGGL